MYDAMISYSRKDEAFAMRLCKGLEKTQRRIWIDKDDIPNASDWWAEIRSGIENADAFIVVISPDSVASQVCGWEIDHAMLNKKKFIPLMYREITDPALQAKMHKALSAHDWIMIREQDDFEKAFKDIIAALETDLDHVKAHTRLTMRAKEWDTNRRDPSLLLQGSDLIAAEHWLAVASTKKPEPTSLHSQYIVESRTITTRRQRIQQAVAAFVTIVLVLGGIALWQAIEANRQRERAEDAQGQAETAREETHRLSLASNSQVALTNQDPDLALALALEANRDISSPETERMLAVAAYQPGTRDIVTNIDGFFSSIVTDGKTILAGGCLNNEAEICATGWLALYDLATGELRQQLDLPDENGITIRAEFSPDGKTILSAGELLHLWDAQTGEMIYELEGHAAFVNGIDFSADGQTAISADEQGGIILWDLADGSIIDEYTAENGIHDIAFLPEQDAFVYGGIYGEVIIQSLEDGEILQEIPSNIDNMEVLEVEVSPDQNYLVWAGTDAVVMLYDFTTESIIPLRGHKSSVNTLQISADSQTLLSGSNDKQVIYWNLATRNSISFLSGHPIEVLSVAFVPGTDYALSSSQDGQLRLWNLTSASYYPPYADDEFIIEILPYQQDVIVVGFYRLYRYNPASGVVVQEWGQDETFASGSLAGNWLVTSGCAEACTADKVAIWDVETGAEVRTFSAGDAIVERVAISPDRQYVVGSTFEDGDIIIWDIETGEILHILDEHFSAANEIQFAPDSQSFYSMGNDLRFLHWDVQTGEILHDLSVSETHKLLSSSNAFAISPDGHSLALGLNNGDLWLWDISLPVPEVVRVFEGHSTNVEGVRFDPTGTYLASVSDDLTVRVWDVATGFELRRYIGHSSYVASVAFIEEGRVVASGGLDGKLRFWRFDPFADLLTWIKENRYVPELTCQERAMYEVEPYCAP